MTRRKAVLLAVVTALVAVAAGTGVWSAVYRPGPHFPEISVYSNGHSTRVGPYLYCNVLNLDDCHSPMTQGELRASKRHPVQLSVPESIAGAPWRLLRIYQDPTATADTLFGPNSRRAVTIPTVDPHRGQLTGIVVQLLTLVVDNGGLREVPHAEWSVALSY
ncbi:DUF2771 domain-containing protein [Mycobacterium sp.]|uniref:DUF2771 domain-containing protein n=1 Tax=Mycobacterium sp. TaxID=1785 RepID=UPI003A8BE82B